MFNVVYGTWLLNGRQLHECSVLLRSVLQAFLAQFGYCKKLVHKTGEGLPVSEFIIRSRTFQPVFYHNVFHDLLLKVIVAAGTERAA